MAACRSCGAWVTWAVTRAGKKVPVEKQVGGNVRLVESLFPDEPPTMQVVDAGKGTHVNHFATCPDAAKWRKP